MKTEQWKEVFEKYNPYLYTDKEIASKIGVSRTTVASARIRLGYKKSGKKKWEEIFKLFPLNKYSYEEISEKTGISVDVVKKRAKEIYKKRRKKKRKSKWKTMSVDKNTISAKELAKKLGISHCAARTQLHRQGISVRENRRKMWESVFKKYPPDVYSASEIAKEAGCSEDAVYKAVRRIYGKKKSDMGIVSNIRNVLLKEINSKKE